MKTECNWHLLTAGRGKWRTSAEGPWETAEQALEFAQSECGVPWAVVHVHGGLFAIGDARGQWRPQDL